LTGIAAVLLFVAAFIVHDVVGDTPDADAPASTFASYYEEHDGNIWLSSILISLAAFFLFWFIGVVRAVVHAAEGGVGRLAATAHAGGIATAVLILASFGTQVSGAILVSERDVGLAPDSAVAYWFIGDGLFLAAFYGAAVLLAATGLAALRTGALPRWLGWVSLVIALVLLVPWINWAAFIFAFPLWVIVVSVLLWQAAGRAPGE
jgi:hypothetical protein